MAITLATIIRQHPDQVSAEMDGETVMMKIDSGLYFGLNDVAGDIWGDLASPKSVGDLIAGVTERYDVDEATCAADVFALVAQLLEHELVQVV